jgi:hypothetical protein
LRIPTLRGEGGYEPIVEADLWDRSEYLDLVEPAYRMPVLCFDLRAAQRIDPAC